MGARIRRLMVIVVAGFALVASSCSSGTDGGALGGATPTALVVTDTPSPTVESTESSPDDPDPTRTPAGTPTPLATPTPSDGDPASPPGGDDGGAAATTRPEPDDPSGPTTAPSPARPTPAATAGPNPTPDGAATPDRPVAANLVVEVRERLGHDPTAFTQGLEFDDGRLYESRGRYGESALTEIDPTTGAVLRRTDLADEFFAEGITVVDDRIIQLTWQERRAFVYDIDTFAVVDEFTYRGEGWGLCLDESGTDRRLIMSNGSDALTFRDPETFAPIGAVDVTLNGRPLDNLNELECVDGLVWANVWPTDSIVVIDPTTGSVISAVDGSGLLPDAERVGASVLNGIARDHDTGRWVITGKLWPAMFVVDFVPA